MAPLLFILLAFASAQVQPMPERAYYPRGVGGGGAMTSFSISPFDNDLWFVYTDMGTAYRSTNAGEWWWSIDHNQFHPGADLYSATAFGFCGDVNVVLMANEGQDPIRSSDSGITFSSISGLESELGGGELILYWLADLDNPTVCLCVTDNGILRSVDSGLTYTRSTGSVDGAPGVGTFFDHANNLVYHATEAEIHVSSDGGASWSVSHTPPGGRGILGFAGGQSAGDVVLTYLDDNEGAACSSTGDSPCGWIWVKENSGSWTQTSQHGGAFLQMAENDANTIYVAGSGDWGEGRGTSVFRSSSKGSSWDLCFLQYDWSVVPFAPWDALEKSAVGLDVGWNDDGYENFIVAQNNKDLLGGTGWYFLHVSIDGGDNWLSPFTRFADTGDRVAGKKWTSVGLEVTSYYTVQFHPSNTQLVYAGIADIGGLLSEDGGDTFRFIRVGLNSHFDYAFDPSDDQIVYTAASGTHDWPMSGYYNLNLGSTGGIYRSANRGSDWTLLTPSSGDFDIGFLSVAYDSQRDILYGGTWGRGIARSVSGGAWEWFNTGIFAGAGQIVGQLEIDPLNGDVYALLSGDAPSWTNRLQTGIYRCRVSLSETSWTLLRGTVHRHPDIDIAYENELWWYPTAFAVDWTDSSRNTLWLVDTEDVGQGAWIATGVWKSTDAGTNWNRMLQYTLPSEILVDGDDVIVTGGYELGDGWGQGGVYQSSDGGASWTKNPDIPLRANGFSVAKDPNRDNNYFYGFFGAAILCGPNCEPPPGSDPYGVGPGDSFWTPTTIAIVAASVSSFLLLLVLLVVVVVIVVCCCKSGRIGKSNGREMTQY